MKKQFPVSPEEIDRRRLHFIEALGKESDRGCVLVGAAVLDEALEQLLRAQMPMEKRLIKEIVDPLFKHPGPFSSFWSRIRTGYALGYLSAETFHDLEVIREVRNRFAHQYGPADLQEATITVLIGSLKAADAGLKYVDSSGERARTIREAAGQGTGQATVTPTMERVRWALAIGWIGIALETATAKYRLETEFGRNDPPFIV